jgi:UDP-sulfoquinovose synthase
MALENAIDSMASLASQFPNKGEHRVINHVTERSYCINEIADIVYELGLARGHKIEIQRNFYNPREENLSKKLDYDIETHFLSARVSPLDLKQVVNETFEIVERNADQIRGEVFAPKVQW